MIVGVLGVCFANLGLGFLLSIAFLVNVKVAESYEYPVITRKSGKTKK